MLDEAHWGASWVLSATATDKLAPCRAFVLLPFHFVVRHQPQEEKDSYRSLC